MKRVCKSKMGDAKMKTSPVFVLVHEGNFHSHSESLVALLLGLSPVRMCSRASSFVEIVRSNVASIHKVVLQERSVCLSICLCSFLNEASLQAKGKRTRLALTGYWASVRKE